jgi:hypothetical protein
VDGHIDGAVKQRSLQLSREKSFSSDMGQRSVLVLIAAGTDDLDGDLQVGVRGAEEVGNLMRLDQGELRSAGSDGDGRPVHGLVREKALSLKFASLVPSAPIIARSTVPDSTNLLNARRG